MLKIGKFVAIGCALALICLGSSASALGQSALITLESRFAKNQSLSDSVQVEINRLLSTSDSLAQMIDKAKTEKKSSLLERRKLENLLRESQTITKRQEGLLALKNELMSERKTLTAQLDTMYDATAHRIVMQLDALGSAQQAKHTALTVELQQLMQKKQQLHQPTSLMIAAPDIAMPQVDSDDTPEEIVAKANLFRDREDKYRAKVAQLERRITQVKSESKLRRRMNEMVDDVRLFDQRDEVVRERVVATATSSYRDKSDYNGVRNPEMLTGIGNTLSLQRADQLLQYDLTTLPETDLKDYITKIEQEKQNLSTSADSLAALSKSYMEQAESLRKSLERGKK